MQRSLTNLPSQSPAIAGEAMNRAAAERMIVEAFMVFRLELDYNRIEQWKRVVVVRCSRPSGLRPTNNFAVISK